MSRVVCFGEIMLRLAPSGYLRFNQATSFDAIYGGGEANVSVSLANYGIDSSFVTKLPDNPIGQCAVNELRKFGVNTSQIARGGLIYSMLNQYTGQDCIEFAVAASCLKHTMEGDFNHAELSEIKLLMKGDGSGRVQR